MAKKKKIEDKTKYIPQLLEDIMGAGFSRYAKAIIQERALPDARDGLKPVQRRILYAMYHDGNTFDHPYRKSAKSVGLVIGNYHPHGESSVYDAMVRMSQDWKVRLPLIDMHGNNGSIDDDPAAAMRYTEARLAKVTQIMEDDLDKDTVEMAPNYDDTEKEPTVLPVPFPVMLVNGATGIAAGYATNMPPHNINEVIDATIYRLQNPNCKLIDLMDIIPGPDFPTGGIVQGEEGIREAFETGKGRVVVRGKCEIVENKKENQIIITEVPYEVVKAQLVKKMDEIRVSKEIDGILDVRDESDRNGLKIVVDLKKEADANLILNYFYKNTDLQVYYSYNNVAIIDKTPHQVGLIDLLERYEKRGSQLEKEIETQRDIFWNKFLSHRNVLIDYGYLKDDYPTERGKTASQIRSENELFISEIMFSGILNELTPAELASVICAVTTEDVRNDMYSSGLPLSPIVRKTLNKIKDIRRKLEKKQNDNNVEDSMYINSFYSALIELWVVGEDWEYIINQVQDIGEGDIVRCFKRVVDVLRQFTTIDNVPDELVFTAREAINAILREPIDVD